MGIWAIMHAFGLSLLARSGGHAENHAGEIRMLAAQSLAAAVMKIEMVVRSKSR